MIAFIYLLKNKQDSEGALYSPSHFDQLMAGQTQNICSGPGISRFLYVASLIEVQQGLFNLCWFFSHHSQAHPGSV